MSNGEVFVQTFTPVSSRRFNSRAATTFTGYYDQELEFRERCEFPPFTHAVLITIRSAHEARANSPPRP